MTALDESISADLEEAARRSVSLAATAAGLHRLTQWNQLGLTWSTNSGGWMGWAREAVTDDRGISRTAMWWVEAPNGTEVAHGFADSLDAALASAEVVLEDAPRPATGVRAAMLDDVLRNNPHLSGRQALAIVRQALQGANRR